ncbi:MAG: alpha/beta fold hydrolase [Actinomycetota bacterium]|nr:alpha/beta fold hydrolase [Actinomycetota bacterium]
MVSIYRKFGITGLSLVAAFAITMPSAPAQAIPLDPSIPAAIAAEYVGKDLRITKNLSSTSAYTRHAITYSSNGLKITGVMNRPRGKGPFPVVVLAHGHIEPSVYVTGQGFRREQDWLARNGYIALHVDYRNHAGSAKDPDSESSMRIGYAADVINAGQAVRSSDLAFIDKDRVALLGRSMGGGVAFQSLVIRPGVFDAAITYASTSTNPADNFNKWGRSDSTTARKILARYGEPKANPEKWAPLMSRNYFSRVTEPVLMIHGTADESCDISWARATRDALVKAGKEVRLVEYKGAGHYMYGPWNSSIREVKAFLKKELA